MQRLITNRLDHLINYLDPLLPFSNCHMVDFFTKNLYETYLPSTIRLEISKLGLQETLNSILNSNFDNKCPELEFYLTGCQNHSLLNSKDICLTLQDFQLKLLDKGCEHLTGLYLKHFMSVKKAHEVEILSEICASINSVVKTDHIVDIGDGKGYLSSALALNNGLKVLGIDASDINTKGASKRVNKLDKQWFGLTGSKNSIQGIYLYKRTTEFISEDADLTSLVREHFPHDSCNTLGLVGLHTCGNLAPSCLHIFNTNSTVKYICNVGCCYHLLDEDIQANSGFPLSDFLKNKQFKLGRNARMLSCQSLDRILHGKELPNVVLFYRALLQVLIMKHCPNLADKHVGRFGQKSPTFLCYVRNAFRKLGADFSVSDEEINGLLNEFVDQEKQLQIFYLIRAHLAPVIEAVILMDRLLFLHENGWTESYLVALFNPIISPRCYGIIAFKDDT